MLHTIENDYLKVTVSDHGAELTSVYDKAQDFERIWCADPAVWNRHAPVLFPFVGKVKDGAYRYNGNTYAMKTQHGFARDAEFTCIEETTDSITHKLVYSDETLEIYPFEFELLITHRFDAENPRLLHVTWAVKNLGSDEMLYSIGGHPGFQIAPGHARSEYSIALPDANPRHYLLLDAAGSGLADTSKCYPFNDAGNAYVPVTDTLFDKDALVFEDGQLPSVGLVDADKKPFVTLTCTDFPYVGIWSKPDGPYVCLEPWIGRTDNMDFTRDLSEKPGEQKLIANAEAVHTYTIEFHSSI